MIGLTLAKTFAQSYWTCKRLTHKNLPGLGKALDLIKNDYVLEVHGKKIFFDRRVGRAYGLMIIGQWNEPETHTFLKYVVAGIDGKINFVDVGASIGEFVIDMAGSDKVALVVAFEPHSESAEAAKKSCEINGFCNVRVIQKVITNSQGDLFFLQDRRSPTSSHIFTSIVNNQTESYGTTLIQGTTLDDELKDLKGSTVVLMDIEGSEYLAMKGALGFIEKWKPLIIFEYNSTSRQSFNLKMVRDLLGPDYLIYRLRADGRVDSHEADSWNMIAVEKSSIFFDAVTALHYRS